MSERTSYEPGTFCWADLNTGDQPAANAFYSALLGWEVEEMPLGGGMTYGMARVNGGDVAAIAPLQEGDPGPARWNSYVAVEDADASAHRAADLGATVVADAFDVFDSGRTAIIQDPLGAVFSVWQADRHIGASRVNEPGALSWNDVLTPDPEASARFYGELFGWTISEVAEGRYWSIHNGETANGGLMRAQQGQPVVWNPYFAVSDLEASLARIDELGGSTIAPAMDVPAGRFALVADPQGATFSLFTGDLDP